MSAKTGEIEFVENLNAPEFFTNGVFERQIMGSVSRLVWYVLRQGAQGPYRETCFTCIIPNEMIGAIIAVLANGEDPASLLAVVGPASKLMM